jgi:hypothetical protein
VVDSFIVHLTDIKSWLTRLGLCVLNPEDGIDDGEDRVKYAKEDSIELHAREIDSSPYQPHGTRTKRINPDSPS